MQRFETLHALLAAQARDDRHISFVDGENDQRDLAFRSLRERALGLLGALQQRGLQPGDAMLLCLGDNERFVEMFWACVLGGIVPVPLAPGGADEHRRKLFRVFGQFERASLYTDAASLDRLQSHALAQGLGPEWERLRPRSIMAGSLVAQGVAGRPVHATPADLAFIQFSSGSTGEPRGVRLSHGNLTANIAAILQAGQFTDQDRALSWMPLSHDMGLIGFHLNMLAGGISHTLMRTDLFARRPLMWLEQASQRRSTVLCSPNFGYQHYLRQHALKRPSGLDLAAVRLVFNGAEPISAELCRSFTHTLAAHGLAENTMFPVYGLAEASLAVSFPQPGAALETLRLERQSLRRGEPAREAPPGAAPTHAVVEFVQLGTPVPGCEIRIADEAGLPLPERSIGRILIRGANVAAAYHLPGRQEPPQRHDGEWLDSGDLGLLWDTQLVVTGRAKDLVIVNGQNLWPHDIERIAEQVPGIEPGRVAAAGVRSAESGTEELAVFVLHRADVAGLAPTALALQHALLQQTGLDSVRIVPVGHLPKTTSGKLQRYALASALEQGEFDAAVGALEQALAALRSPAGGPSASAVEQPSTLVRLQAICQRLIANTPITPETNLFEINLNSLTLARIHEGIEREFPQRIEVTDLFDYPTLNELASVLDSPRP